MTMRRFSKSILTIVVTLWTVFAYSIGCAQQTGGANAIPDFTGTNAGLQFRTSINDRLYGKTATSPILVSPVLQGQTVAPTVAISPARLESYNSQWVPATVNHISAAAGFSGANPSEKINAALASPLCSDGCIVDDGLVPGSAALVQDSAPIVVGKNQLLVLHAHHYYGGVTLTAPAITLAGSGAGVVCEQTPGYVDAIGAFWNGSCGIDLAGALGGQPAIEIAASGTVVKGLTIRGDRNMASIIVVPQVAVASDLTWSGTTITTAGSINWMKLGFVPGETILVAGSLHNNLQFTVSGVTATVLTLTASVTIESAGASTTVSPTVSVDYVQISGNTIRGTYYDNHTTSFGIDIGGSSGGGNITNNVVAEDNVIFFTSGAIRYNPSATGGNMIMRGNWYLLGYGPAYVVGPGYTFDTKIDSDSCAFSQVSTANESHWLIEDADSIDIRNNQNECHDISGLGGNQDLKITGSTGTVENNSWNGNQDDILSAHDNAYNIYLTSTAHFTIDTNLLKQSSTAGIHFGSNVTDVDYKHNTYIQGHASTGTYTDGRVLPIYGASASGSATGGPTGWADTCYGCTGEAVTANKYFLFGKYFPNPVSFSQMCVNISVADGAHNSDLCIYDAQGNLVANAGAQHMSSTGNICFAPNQSTPIILPPGLYFYGLTSAGGVLNVNASSTGNQLAYSLNTAYGTSSGGACGSTITPPTQSPTPAGSEFGLF